MADSVRSYGGVAGQSAVTEDLERGARILTAAAQLLEDAGLELRTVDDYVDTARVQGSEPTRRAATSASDDLWAARYGSSGIGTIESTASDLAARLRRVAQGFLEAEQGAMSHVSALTRLGRAAESMWGTGIWVARHTWATALLAGAAPLALPGPSQRLVGAVRPDGLPPTTGFLNKDTAHLLVARMDNSALGFAARVYALAAALAALEGLFGEAHASTAMERLSSYPPRRPTGLEDVMDGLQAEENRMDGSVSIETITHSDGTHGYIVTIPGTEDWAFDDNPYDAQANLAGVIGGASDAQMAIVDAMRAAGIEPGAEVMLAGHSQGGINAVALASRPEFLAEFNVTHVVTAGSPVGRIALPPSVQALHLEHTEDLVAGLEGAPNPDSATRTTVERDLTLSGVPGIQALGQNVAGAHHLSAYGSTAALVDQGKAGTSATAWKQSAAQFFTGEPSTLTEYVPVAPRRAS